MQLSHLQFKDQHHFIIVFESVVEIDEFIVMKLIHDINLFANQRLLRRTGGGRELCGEYVTRLLFTTPVNHAECTFPDFFEDFIVIFDIGALDLNRLGYEAGINVEGILIIVLDGFLGLSTYSLSVLVHWKYYKTSKLMRTFLQLVRPCSL